MNRRRKSSQKTTTRRRSRRSAVKRKVRRAGRKIKRGARKHSKSIITTVTNILPVVEGIQLLSHNQVKASGDGAEAKVKAIVNGITGSLFDFNVFQDAPKAHFNPKVEGAFNQWTYANGGAIVLGMIGQKLGLKHSSKVKNAGAKGIIPSVIFGIFGKGNDTPQDTFKEQGITVSSSQSSSSGGSGVA